MNPAGNDKSSIIIYYFDLTDTDYFCRILERRFRESGHKRRIEFRNWNCYKSLPGEDGDIFIYDGVTMTALVEKGYLHQLPEIIDISDMFSWTIDRSKVQTKTYGIPLMLCTNTLICRKEDDRNVRNVMELHEKVAIPMRTMFMYYYLQAFCNYQADDKKIREVFEHLVGLMGGREFLDKSSLGDYDGTNRFNSGECRYLLGFTENLRSLGPGEYAVRFANFSDNGEDQMPLFMVDYASLGNHVREEKLLDCMDLLEIMADGRFIFELCSQEGKLQYMLPACKSVYHDLARLDPLYGVLRYGKRFYEEFYKKSDDMLNAMMKPE